MRLSDFNALKEILDSCACGNFGMERYRIEALFAESRVEIERLRKLETRLFQMIAMGDEITVEAFSDLAEPDTDAARDERRERAIKNISSWAASCDYCEGLFNSPDRPEGSQAEMTFDAYEETGHFPSCHNFPTIHNSRKDNANS
jgi:hypothetical protein